jgi:hypothetical protein
LLKEQNVNLNPKEMEEVYFTLKSSKNVTNTTSTITNKESNQVNDKEEQNKMDN